MAYGGVIEDPAAARRARSVAGGLLMNFGTIELMSIAVIRLVMPSSRNRRDLINSSLSNRIDQIVKRVPAATCFSQKEKESLMSAFEDVKPFLEIRHIVAHEPFVYVTDKALWVWSFIRSSEPDLRQVGYIEVDDVAKMNDQLVVVARRLEQSISAHFGRALSSERS